MLLDLISVVPLVVINHSPEQTCRAYYLYFVIFFFFFFSKLQQLCNKPSFLVFPSCTTQKHMLVVITREQMGISTFPLCTSGRMQIILQTLKQMKLCVAGCKMLLRKRRGAACHNKASHFILWPTVHFCYIFSVSNISVSHVKTFVCSRHTTNKEDVDRTPANSGSSHTKIKEFAWQHFCYCCSNTSD